MAADSPDAEPEQYYYLDSDMMQVYHCFDDCPALGYAKADVKTADSPQDIEFTEAGPVQTLEDSALCALCQQRLDDEHTIRGKVCPFCGERFSMLPTHLPCD